VETTKDFTGATFDDLDLQGIDFSQAILVDTNFLNCNLTGANFDRADLLGATLDGSALTCASFIRADLDGTYLRRTELSRANFSRAHIRGCTFQDSVLTDATFHAASIFGADFTGVDMDFDLSKATMAWVTGTNLPVLITGLDYPIKIHNNVMDIGCQSNHIDWYAKDGPGPRGIAAMEGLKSARFWKKNKTWIMELIKANALNKS